MATAAITRSGLTLAEERFCQRIVATGKQQQSYADTHNVATWSANAIAVEASRLMDQPKIRLRVAELAEEALAAEQVTAGYIVSTLRRNVDRAMQVEAVLDKDGNPTGEYRYEGHVANDGLATLAKIRRLLDTHIVVQDDAVARRVLERLDAAMTSAMAQRGGRWSSEQAETSLLPAHTEDSVATARRPATDSAASSPPDSSPDTAV